jgi:hypothetical protein
MDITEAFRVTTVEQKAERHRSGNLKVAERMALSAHAAAALG